MGYDFHITRRVDWADEDENGGISLDEWLRYIESDHELQLTDGYLVRVPGSETESQPVPGYVEWTGHPSGLKSWFVYSYGCIDTKNPDEATVRKMLVIASALVAKVQGDDGEIWGLSPDNKIISDNGMTVGPIKASGKKAWWKFW